MYPPIPQSHFGSLWPIDFDFTTNPPCSEGWRHKKEAKSPIALRCVCKIDSDFLYCHP